MKPSTAISLLAACLALCIHTKTSAQTNTTNNDTLQVAMLVQVDRAFYKGDSIPNVTLHEFFKYPPRQFKNERERIKYDKLVRNVKYVFPYARLVRTILIETHDYLQTLDTEKEKKQHIKAVERGIRKQYEPTVRKISKTQGKLLVKLIDRECGQTSFEMIKAFLGSARANMYNVLSSLFGNNLRKHYDPQGEDREIERIVLMVESGQL
jgi:hypothetical protein